MTIGQMVRKIRKEKGLSILQVKELSGLSKSTISEIENDKSSPTSETLIKLANVFGINAGQFFSKE